MGAAHRAPPVQPDPAGQQPCGKFTQAHQAGSKKLVICGPSRCRRSLGDHLFAGRLLPAPRQGPSRLFPRCAHPTALNDQQRRSRSAAARELVGTDGSSSPLIISGQNGHHSEGRRLRVVTITTLPKSNRSIEYKQSRKRPSFSLVSGHATVMVLSTNESRHTVACLVRCRFSLPS